MRGLVIAFVLSACSSAEVATVADTAAPTCATTSCVAGASCRLPSGGTCQCFAAGEWTCGTGTSFDAGPVFDTAPTDSVFVAPPADTGAAPPDTAPPPAAMVTFPLSEGGCGSSFAACTDAATVDKARTRLREVMAKCRLDCSAMMLETTAEGCPIRVSTNFEPIEGALACVANGILSDRYPCARTIEVTLSTSCLD